MDEGKNIVIRLKELQKLNELITGSGCDSTQESTKYKICEIHKNFNIIKLREMDPQLAQLNTWLLTFTDLEHFDDLQFWKLHENNFSDIIPSRIIDLSVDKEIDLILRFYLQAFLNKAY